MRSGYGCAGRRRAGPRPCCAARRRRCRPSWARQISVDEEEGDSTGRDQSLFSLPSCLRKKTVFLTQNTFFGPSKTALYDYANAFFGPKMRFSEYTLQNAFSTEITAFYSKNVFKLTNSVVLKK